MQIRPSEKLDDRILVIKITEEDRRYQDRMGMERKDSSLADAALEQLLRKLEPYQPSIIGLDIYRDFKVSYNYPTLASQLHTKTNLFAVCKAGDPAKGEAGIAPPPELAKDLFRLGFSDVVLDSSDSVLRRYLWKATFENSSLCQTEESLSLKLALDYLSKEGFTIEVNQQKEYIEIDKKIQLTRITKPTGGYQKFDDSGYQMLLNYRRTDGDVAQSATLTDILEGNFKSDWVKDKIILIGVTAESVKDNFLTPFSKEPDQTMRGVFVQAQMVSQIISAVLDGRPLLSVWNPWGEGAWIWAWAIIGALIGWRHQRFQYYIILTGLATIILFGSCYILFIVGWWVPLLTSGLALTGTLVLMRNCDRILPVILSKIKESNHQ